MPAPTTLLPTVPTANPLRRTPSRRPTHPVTHSRATPESLPVPLKDSSSDLAYPYPAHTPRPTSRISPWVDVYLHYRGLCPLCRGDARHRLLDALCYFAKNGETPDQLSLVFGYPAAFVARVIVEGPYTGQHSTTLVKDPAPTSVTKESHRHSSALVASLKSQTDNPGPRPRPKKRSSSRTKPTRS